MMDAKRCDINIIAESYVLPVFTVAFHVGLSNLAHI